MSSSFLPLPRGRQLVLASIHHHPEQGWLYVIDMQPARPGENRRFYEWRDRPGEAHQAMRRVAEMLTGERPAEPERHEQFERFIYYMLDHTTPFAVERALERALEPDAGEDTPTTPRAAYAAQIAAQLTWKEQP